MKYLFTVVVVVLLSVPVRAQESFYVKDSGQLKGIGAVLVLVERLDPEVERLGLREADIQRDTELKLRTAGIRVETEAQSSARGSGYLYVFVNAVCNDVVCGYDIDVSYEESVMARRDPANIIVRSATTWSTGMIGTIGSSRVREVRDSVKDKVDEFINAYLTANPVSRSSSAQPSPTFSTTQRPNPTEDVDKAVRVIDTGYSPRGLYVGAPTGIVRRMLGEPDRTIRNGDRILWYYGEKYVTFVDGELVSWSR